MALTGDKSEKDWPEGELSWESFTPHMPSPFFVAGVLAARIRKGKAELMVLDLGRQRREQLERLAGIELEQQSRNPIVTAASFRSSHSRIGYCQPQMKIDKKEISRCSLFDTKNKNVLEKSIPMAAFPPPLCRFAIRSRPPSQNLLLRQLSSSIFRAGTSSPARRTCYLPNNDSMQRKFSAVKSSATVSAEVEMLAT